jgi:hypothetical protein
LSQHRRARDLRAEGRALLDGGRFREAAFVFGRLLLLDPGDTAARADYETACRSEAEAERLRSLGEQPGVPAAESTEELRAAAAAPAPGGAGRPPRPREARSERVPRRARWSRRALVAAWATAFALLSAGVASSWETIITSLVRAPEPAAHAAPPTTLIPTIDAGEQALAEARRELDRGDVAPAYPFARRLREEALGRGGGSLPQVTPGAAPQATPR